MSKQNGSGNEFVLLSAVSVRAYRIHYTAPAIVKSPVSTGNTDRQHDERQDAFSN